MKKYLFILMAAIAFVACNDDEATPNNPGDNSQERTIKTVDETPAQVEAFFSDVNTAMWVNRKILGFTYRKNEICIINSQEELSNLYNGDKPLPEIDFSKYTLLVGHVLAAHSGHLLERTELTEKDGSLTLYVYIRALDEGLAVITPILYWGLYPKLSQKEINVVPLTADGKACDTRDTTL